MTTCTTPRKPTRRGKTTPFARYLKTYEAWLRSIKEGTDEVADALSDAMYDAEPVLQLRDGATVAAAMDFTRDPPVPRLHVRIEDETGATALAPADFERVLAWCRQIGFPMDPEPPSRDAFDGLMPVPPPSSGTIGVEDVVLCVLREMGLARSPNEVAERSGLTRESVAKALRSLEEAGKVELWDGPWGTHAGGGWRVIQDAATGSSALLGKATA